MTAGRLVMVVPMTALAVAGCSSSGAARSASVACPQPYPDKQSTDVCADVNGTLLVNGMSVTSRNFTRSIASIPGADPELCADVTMVNSAADSRNFNQFDFKLQTPAGEVKSFDLTNQPSIGSGVLIAGGTKTGKVCSKDAPQETGQFVLIYKPVATNRARGIWLLNLAPAATAVPPAAQLPAAPSALPPAPIPQAPIPPSPGLSAGSVETLDRSPQLCESGTGPLGCSYRFRVSGPDLVRAFAGESVSARLALVGPGYATDGNGRRFVLVRVRVTALTNSVSLEPTEFTASGYAGRDFASTVAVSGLADQVRSTVRVPAGSDFVGTLAFPDRSARQVNWLLSNRQPAASWDLPG